MRRQVSSCLVCSQRHLVGPTWDTGCWTRWAVGLIQQGSSYAFIGKLFPLANEWRDHKASTVCYAYKPSIGFVWLFVWNVYVSQQSCSYRTAAWIRWPRYSTIREEDLSEEVFWVFREYSIKSWAIWEGRGIAEAYYYPIETCLCWHICAGVVVDLF